MKNYDSMETIERAFAKAEELPQIDVTDKVMNKIQQKKSPLGSKLAFRLLIGMLVVTSVGFITYKTVFELKGPGNHKYEYHAIANDGFSNIIPQEAYQSDYDKLKPGEYLAVTKVKNNPKNSVTLMNKPVTANSLEELKKLTNNNAIYIPAKLPAGYSFSHAELTYKYDDSIFGEINKEAAKCDKEYFLKLIKPSNSLSTCAIIYQKGKTTIHLSINFDWQGNAIRQAATDNNIITVKVNNFEAVYNEQKDYAQLEWLDGRTGSTNYYSISDSTVDENTKKMLVELAESFEKLDIR